jgi:UDPglucose 6-dehydrogenase
MLDTNSKIGFIGQGWIGKNYADDFERRGFKTVRYSLDKNYLPNKDLIKECDLVFIAVPTPSTPNGFNPSIVEEGLSLVGENKVAVIKSTIVPGTTSKFKVLYPNIKIFYSPEFLSEATAKFDVENPFSNIIGVSSDLDEDLQIARDLLKIFPKAPFELICKSTEAEMIKYSHNLNGYFQIVMFNLMYDVAKTLECDWGVIKDAIKNDPMMNGQYSDPIHKSGRGAGGGCFVKDMAAFRERYEDLFPDDKEGIHVLKSLETKNIKLLKESNKDLSIVSDVYGD